jgi:hypothetical protein
VEGWADFDCSASYLTLAKPGLFTQPGGPGTTGPVQPGNWRAGRTFTECKEGRIMARVPAVTEAVRKLAQKELYGCSRN